MVEWGGGGGGGKGAIRTLYRSEKHILMSCLAAILWILRHWMLKCECQNLWLLCYFDASSSSQKDEEEVLRVCVCVCLVFLVYWANSITNKTKAIQPASQAGHEC